MLKSEYMAEILGKTDLIIFLSNFAKDNEVWTRKETTVQAILPKSSFIQEEYQKHISPRDGYTWIIEKHKKQYDSCMMQLHTKKGLIIKGHLESQTQISGWIFVTSPKEVY